MILTCPECASRYFVDDARIGPEGRKVRCAGCGHAWRQTAEIEAGEATLTLHPMAGTLAELGDPSLRPRERTVPPVSTRLREQAVEKRKTREAAAVGVVWAVLGASFCVLALAAAIFRVDVVRLAPATAGAYAFVHLPVNAVGLSIEAVQGGPGLENGRAALHVSGVVRNVETHPRAARALRVILLDKAEHRLASKIVTPPPGDIQPGETRPFTTSFLDPPLQAAGVQVDFVLDPAAPKSKTASRPVKAPVVELKLRGTAPPPAPPVTRISTAATPVPASIAATPIPAARIKDAAPLPATSPYALPASAAHTHG